MSQMLAFLVSPIKILAFLVFITALAVHAIGEQEWMGTIVQEWRHAGYIFVSIICSLLVWLALCVYTWLWPK